MTSKLTSWSCDSVSRLRILSTKNLEFLTVRSEFPVRGIRMRASSLASLHIGDSLHTLYITVNVKIFTANIFHGRGSYTYSWDIRVEIFCIVHPTRKGKASLDTWLPSIRTRQQLLIVLARLFACSCTGLRIKATIAPLLRHFRDCHCVYLLASFCNGLSQDWCSKWPLGVW